MARGRMYSAVFEKVAVTAAQDLFELNAPADAVVIVHSVKITQDTEEGDAEAEQLSVLAHMGSTSGSGGSTPTPTPKQLGSPAFGGTVEANNTSQSTEGTFQDTEAWNVQIGLHWIFTPDEQIVISPSDRLIIELQDAPTDSITMSGTITFEELGG